MSTRTNTVRGVALAALMIMSMVIGASGTVAAAGHTVTKDNRQVTETRDTITEYTAVVYLGEENVNISAVSSDSISPGDSVSFTGIAGDAEGSVATASNASKVDFTVSSNFETGGYDIDNDDNVEVSVVDPSVTDVTAYLGSGQTAIANDVEVTDGVAPKEAGAVTIQADFNFDDAESAEVVVKDSSGLDVTEAVSNSSKVYSGEALFNRSGDYITLDFTDQENGIYNITVEGSDSFEDTSRTIRVTVADGETQVMFGQSEVTKGDSAVGSIVGAPGDVVQVRISGDDLADGETVSKATAENVFENTGDILSRYNSSSLVATSVELGDDGEAKFRVNSEYLEEDSTAEVEIVDKLSRPGVTQSAALAMDANDTADLSVVEPSVTIDSAPSSVYVGEEFTLTGVAEDSDEVYAYAEIDNTWVALSGADSTYAMDSVDSDGAYEIEVDSSETISLTDTYRIAVVNDPGSLSGVSAGDNLDRDQYSEALTETTTITTTEGGLNVDLTRDVVAANGEDTVSLVGEVTGQGEDLNVFVVSPRGEVTTLTPDIDDENMVDEEFDASLFETRGNYNVIVVSEGRDGSFNTDLANVSTTMSGTQSQNVAIIEDAYTGAGVDDNMANLQLSAETSSISVDDFTTNGEVAQGDVKVSGETNHDSETVLYLEVLGNNSDVVASDQAEVSENGTWSATLNMSAVETGEYTFYADSNDASEQMDFLLVEQVNTPEPEPENETDTDTPEPEPENETDTGTPEPEPETDSSDTDNDDEEATSSSPGQPGFGVVVALIAVIAAALLAYRRD